jgi:hypothetical protein
MTAEDLGEVSSVSEALLYTDDGLVHFEVRAHHDQAVYSWLKWWAGDTEVGYLFAKEGVSILAVVSDGDIVDCLIMGPK